MIIRRTTRSGIPVGGYLRIVQGGAIHNIAEFLEIHKMFSKEQKQTTMVGKDDNVAFVKYTKLIVSDYIFDRLLSGIQHTVLHDATQKWLEIKAIEPELIQIRSVKYAQKVMVFKVDKIGYTNYGRTRLIKLELGQRIE